MAKIDANLMSAAKKIAYELNKKDGSTTDNKIMKEHWDVFALSKGAKDNVKEYISIKQAEISIYSYLTKNAAKSQESPEDLGEKWFLEITKPPEEVKVNDIAAEEVLQEIVVTSERNNKRQVIQLSESLSNFEPPKDIASIEVPVSTYIAKPPVINIINNENKITAEKSNGESIDRLITEELHKRGMREQDVDIPYWRDKIQRVSSQFNIPAEIIVSIISKETRFTKNISCNNGKGAMQLTGIAIRSFFPGCTGSWHDLYEKLDKDLFEDILYKKDIKGNVVMSNGKPVLKYNNWQELLNACGKNDELSIKVGSLIFEMKYAEAVAAAKFGRSTYANLPTVIAQLQSGEITLDANTNKSCISQAIKNYNGNAHKIRKNGQYISIKEDYKRDIMDSLNVHGYDFAEPILRKA